MRVLFVVFMWTLNIIATKTTDLRACENLNFDDDIWGRTSNTNWGLNYQETQKKPARFIKQNQSGLQVRFPLFVHVFLSDGCFPIFLG